MKITSYPITRDIRIGRIKSDPCEIVFVLNEDGSPMDLTGKVLELAFLSGGHAMLTLSPDDVDGNKVLFALTEEEKNKLYANLIYISVKLDGVTIGEGRFEWGSTHGEKSELPKAIGINVNNVTESIEWFEVIIGPRGEKGELTEEDKALLDSKVQDAESAKNTAVGASNSASNAASSANSAAITAGNAATAAGGSATAAGNSATAASGSATSASNSATSAGTARDQAIVAKNAAELAAATIDNNGEVAEGDVRLVSGDKVNSALAPFTIDVNIGNHQLTNKNNNLKGLYTPGGGADSSTNNWCRTGLEPCEPDTVYTMSGNILAPSASAVVFYDASGVMIGNIVGNGGSVYTFTTPVDCRYRAHTIGNAPNVGLTPSDNTLANRFMVNKGAVALPYEPYVGGENVFIKKVKESEVVRYPIFYSYSKNGGGYSAGLFTIYSQIKSSPLLYVGFKLDHFFSNNDAIYADMWRIQAAKLYRLSNGVMVDTGLNAITEGESESVYKIEGTDDFTGGAHGDEKLTSVIFYADNSPIDLSQDILLTPADSFRYEQVSNMHKTATGGITDHSIEAVHTKVTSFFNGGYSTSNKLVWQKSLVINIWYHGISCISKDFGQVVYNEKGDSFVANGDNGIKLSFVGLRKYKSEHIANGLKCEASSILLKPNNDASCTMQVWDRPSTDNKYYRRPPNNISVSNGIEWESVTSVFFDKM